MNKAMRPEGIWGAVLLPIDQDGAIDWHTLVEETEILCHSDLAGIYTNGSAGEFHNQTEAEFEKLAGTVADIASKFGKPFQIGVNCTNPRMARDRLKKVNSLGPAAVQFTLPDWWPPTFGEIQRFLEGMQEAAQNTPLVIYNPPHAKVQISLRQIAKLREVAPGMVGAKLRGGNTDWYAERRKLGKDFSVFVPGHSVAFGRPLGADGSYSNVACLSPKGAVKLWNLSEADPEAATAIEMRIVKFLEQTIMPLAQQFGYSDPALDKLLAAAGGWGPVSSDLLWPYTGATPNDVDKVAQAARKALPELCE
ncbi:MAG: dihydrodipicolinate synthase family protein [Maritalea sp.]